MACPAQAPDFRDREGKSSGKGLLPRKLVPSLPVTSWQCQAFWFLLPSLWALSFWPLGPSSLPLQLLTGLWMQGNLGLSPGLACFWLSDPGLDPEPRY